MEMKMLEDLSGFEYSQQDLLEARKEVPSMIYVHGDSESARRKGTRDSRLYSQSLSQDGRDTFGSLSAHVNVLDGTNLVGT